MSATDELRRMLDERGVAHSDHYLSTTWRDGHGILHLAGEPMADGSLVVDMLTPEQAIAATLGNSRAERTCENIAPDYLDFLCSKCGFVHYHSDENDTDDGNDWNYCPNCGAKVVG